tara:strand:- start:25 stop:285 length:261 start_codon:yes stop_codon:yes gene_type:complete
LKYKKEPIRVIRNDVTKGLNILSRPLLSKIVFSKIKIVIIGAKELSPGFTNQREEKIEIKKLKTIIFRYTLLTIFIKKNVINMESR